MDFFFSINILIHLIESILFRLIILRIQKKLSLYLGYISLIYIAVKFDNDCLHQNIYKLNCVYLLF
jgi:hypothetical protein